MLLRFVAGRAGSGKSTWVYEAVREDMKRSDRPVYIVVPEQYTLQTEKELIEALGVRGVMQARVTSPSRLALEVFSQVEQDRKTAVGQAGLAMALRASVSGIAAELAAFRSVLGYTGFSTGMVRLISEMKQFDITPDAMRTASAGARGALKSKARDIAAIYESYNTYLSDRKYTDGEDRFNHFVACIARADFLHGCSFYFDGFDSLPPQHCRMVGELLAVAESVTVTLDYDGFESEDSDLFHAARNNVNKLGDIAKALGADIRWVHIRTDARQCAMPPDIAHLERSLFTWAAEPAQARGGVTLCRAADTEEEVYAAAAWIAARVREGGLHWREVAVQCGDLKSYAPVVTRVFARYGIPAFVDSKKEISGHPAVRFILSLLKVIERDWRADDALRLVKTGYAGVDAAGADTLEVYLAAFAPRGARMWARLWVKGQDAYDLAALNLNRERLYGLAQTLLKRAGGRRASGSRWASALYDLLMELDFEGRLAGEARALRRAGLVEESAVTERIWNAVVDLLDELTEIIADDTLDAAEFGAVLKSGFESVEEGILPTGVDQVQVGSIGRSKYSGLQYMLILGASIGSLSEGGEDGAILSGRDVDALAELGVEVGRGSALKSSQRRFAIYESVTKGARGLYISWPQTAGANGETGPDRIVERVMELLNIGLDGVLDASALTAEPSPARGSFGRLPSLMRRFAEGEQAGAEQTALLKWFLDSPQYRERVSRLIRAAAGEAPVELLPAAGLIAGSAATVTASQLETYGGCPFRHYVRYALMPQEWRMHGIEGADAGRFLHAAMESFGTRLAAMKYDIAALDEAGAAKLMRAEAERLVDEFDYGVLTGSAKLKWTGANLTRVCAAASATFLLQLRNGDFLPYGQEIRFGKGGVPSAPLPLGDGGTAFLQGRIDRLDILHAQEADWLVVLDYKSGKSSIDVHDAVNGIDMQTWLYMAALRSIWEKVDRRPARPAGAYIFPLLDPWAEDGPDAEREKRKELRLRGWCLKDGDVAAALDREAAGGRSELYQMNAGRGTGLLEETAANAALRLVEECAGRFASEIRRGRIAAYPWRRGGESACENCPNGALCRFSVRQHKTYRQLLDNAAVDAMLGGGEGAVGGAVDE